MDFAFKTKQYEASFRSIWSLGMLATAGQELGLSLSLMKTLRLGSEAWEEVQVAEWGAGLTRQLPKGLLSNSSLVAELGFGSPERRR